MAKIKQKFTAWMTYDNDAKEFEEEVYFKRPTTRHVHPWKVSKKVIIQEA